VFQLPGNLACVKLKLFIDLLPFLYYLFRKSALILIVVGFFVVLSRDNLFLVVLNELMDKMSG